MLTNPVIWEVFLLRNPSNGGGSSDFSLFHLNFLGDGFFSLLGGGGEGGGT